MRRRFTLAIVGVAAGAIIVAGLGTLLLLSIQGRRQARKDVTQLATRIATDYSIGRSASNPLPALSNLQDLLRSTQQLTLVVVRPDGQTEPRELVVGMSNQQLVEVRSGLRLGEKVVLNPASLSLAGDEAASPDKAGKTAEDEARKSKASGDQPRPRKS